MQGSKLRPIDDYSRSQVNSAISIYDQVTTDGVDVVAAMVALHMKELSEAGLSTRLVGSQFCISTVVHIRGVKQSHPFRQISLPFGSKAAVNAFIRCARCIHWFAARCLRVLVSCYFDDFILISKPELSKSSESCVSSSTVDGLGV